MTEPVPQDCGIAETNDPSVRVLWERDGATVRLHLVHDKPQPTTVWTLPGPPG